MEPTKTENPTPLLKQYENYPKNNQLVEISLSIKSVKKSCDWDRNWRMEVWKFERNEFIQNWALLNPEIYWYF